MNVSESKRLQRRLGYQFNDINLLELALTHRSFASVNNERLEFLGDALLSAIISERLYQQFPDVKEGILSGLRSSLVKGETLAEIAIEFSFSDYLIMSSGELKSGGFRRKSILADVVEAIIGAIFLDSGMDECKCAVLRWFDERLDQLQVDDRLKDPKTQLQELLQSRKQPLPVYNVAQVDGASHDQSFTITCSVSLLSSPKTSVASSRRQAEKDAAQQVLDALNNGESSQ